jgi:Domain of unknown function (DUF4956)
MLDFLTLQTTSTNPSFISIVYTVLLSFVLSTIIAITYEKTFRGLSYSRNYVQALILGSIAAGMIVQAIGDNLARGLGMMGALSIIRFRTSFRDPRDIIFMFAALASGISCGVFGFGIAVVGTAGFCLAATFLYFSPFGEYRYYDGLLRFNIPVESEDRQKLEDVIKNQCKTFALITLRETNQGTRLEYAYHVKLKNGKTKESLVDAVRPMSGIKDVNLMLQETTVEI